MDLVEQTLHEHGIAPERIHIERFTPADALPEPEPAAGQTASETGTHVEIELDGKVQTTTIGPARRSCRRRGRWG